MYKRECNKKCMSECEKKGFEANSLFNASKLQEKCKSHCDKECKIPKEQEKSDSSFAVRTGPKAPSFEFGSAGPLVFTSKGAKIEYAQVGNFSFTSEGPEFRW